MLRATHVGLDTKDSLTGQSNGVDTIFFKVEIKQKIEQKCYGYEKWIVCGCGQFVCVTNWWAGNVGLELYSQYDNYDEFT